MQRKSHVAFRRVSGRSRIRGVGLIEVLVSLVIFSIGILGLVKLQVHSIQVDTQASDRTRAANLANEIVTQMWTSKTSSPSEAALEAWNTRVADAANGGLPNGVGDVEEDDGVVTVTITWRPPWLASTEPAHTYLTQVVIP